MKVIRASVTALNLKFLIVDILEKQRNLAFTTSKRTYVYRANKLFKNFIYQNKGFKRTESFKPSNRRWRFDKGSSYNIYFKDDEEGFKDVETELESELELQSFIYVIEDFDLDDNKSSCFISSWSFRNNIKNVENVEIESDYFIAFNKSKRPLK